MLETSSGLTFIETTLSGLNFTTVYNHMVDPTSNKRAAVTSRHLDLGDPLPSQFYGTCVLLR